MIERPNSLESLETVQWAFRKRKTGGEVRGERVGGGGLRTCFFDKTPEDLGLLLYPETFQTKWSFTPGISRNCFTPYGNSKAYIQDSWKLYMMFFYQPCIFFSLARGISTFCFFNTPENSMSSTPPCIFFLK